MSKRVPGLFGYSTLTLIIVSPPGLVESFNFPTLETPDGSMFAYIQATWRCRMVQMFAYIRPRGADSWRSGAPSGRSGVAGSVQYSRSRESQHLRPALID